jgi:hypothetical protein
MNKIVLQGKSSIEHFLKVEVMDNLMGIKFVFPRLGVRNEKRCQHCGLDPTIGFLHKLAASKNATSL